jgi:hypothetical protein
LLVNSLQASSIVLSSEVKRVKAFSISLYPPLTNVKPTSLAKSKKFWLAALKSVSQLNS